MFNSDPMESLISVFLPPLEDDDSLSQGTKRKSIPLDISQISYVDEIVERSSGAFSATKVIQSFISLGLTAFLTELSSRSPKSLEDFSVSVNSRILSFSSSAQNEDHNLNVNS
jgi:hypothetical protein